MPPSPITTIPAVMFIEAALAALKNQKPDVIAAECREFELLGIARTKEALEQLHPYISSDLMAGYLIGLETARFVLAMTPRAIQAGVTI